MKKREGSTAKKSAQNHAKEVHLYGTGDVHDEFVPGYDPEVDEVVQPQPQKAVSWEATEDVSQKTLGWYVLLLLCGLAVTALIALLTRDIASTATVFLAVIILLMYANRKPSKQTYLLQNGVIGIEQKQYDMHAFKAFSIDEHGRQPNIVLTPLKRFMPSLVLPLEAKSAEEVVKTLAMFLPLEEHKADLIDALVRKIRL